MHFHSMTRTLTGAIADPDQFAHIEAADTTFTFNCLRKHVFTADGAAPFELTWAGQDQKFDYVSAADVTDELWNTWIRFRDAIEKAEADGRVQWRDDQPDWDIHSSYRAESLQD